MGVTLAYPALTSKKEGCDTLQMAMIGVCCVHPEEQNVERQRCRWARLPRNSEFAQKVEGEEVAEGTLGKTNPGPPYKASPFFFFLPLDLFN